MCVPQVARDQVFGVIHLDGTADPLTKEDMAVLVEVARQASSGVDPFLTSEVMTLTIWMPWLTPMAKTRKGISIE